MDLKELKSAVEQIVLDSGAKLVGDGSKERRENASIILLLKFKK